MTNPLIAALLREREHYIRRGLPDRAAQVAAELARMGYEDPTTPPPPADIPETTTLQAPPETATPPRPRPRRSSPHAQDR